MQDPPSDVDPSSDALRCIRPLKYIPLRCYPPLVYHVSMCFFFVLVCLGQLDGQDVIRHQRDYLVVEFLESA